MKNETKQRMIWSYLDGSLQAEDRLSLELLKSTDAEFNSMFEELSALHTGLDKLPLEKVSQNFSDNLQKVLMKEVSKQQNGMDFRPLLFFGISLLVMSIAFFLFTGNPSTSLFAYDTYLDGLFDITIYDGLLNLISGIELKIEWYYFVLLFMLPIVFILDSVVESKLLMRHFIYL